MMLIIGYGNPLRGDDGVGWRVAEAAGTALPEGAATVLAVHQLTPELSAPISRAGRVVFVDAAAEGEDAGNRQLGSAALAAMTSRVATSSLGKRRAAVCADLLKVMPPV